MRVLKVAFLSLLFTMPVQAGQGVSDNEIVIGSVNDLSGPFAAFGAPAVAAAHSHFENVNAGGGIHGRKIRFIVEDSSYQLPKALQGYNKLINRDKVFAMVLSIGTPMNLAGFKLMTPKNIPNFGPLSASREMVSKPIRLRFSISSNYFDQTRLAARYLAKHEGISKACAMILPTDFGNEVLEGIKDEAGVNSGIDYVSETKHRPDELDFVGSLQKLASQGCELIALALGVRQTITVVATAKKLGLGNIRFVGTAASFHTTLAKVPGGLTEGLYASAGWADLAARTHIKEPAEFISAHMKAHGQFPGTGALLGHFVATTFTRALEKAGRDLTVDSFLKAVESLDFYSPLIDNHVSFSATDHAGVDTIVLSVIESGNWKEVARLN